MGAQPPVANVLKVQLGWSAELDSLAQSVLHFMYSGTAPSSATCATIAAGASAAQQTAFSAIVGVGSSMGLCTVTDLTSSSAGQGTGGTVAAGTRVGAELAAGTAALINMQIQRRYRGGKPRTYLPVGVAGDIVAGQWTTAFNTLVSNSWTTFLGDFLATYSGTIVNSWGCVSYREGNAPRAIPIFEQGVNYTTPRLVASQRRRNRNQ